MTDKMTLPLAPSDHAIESRVGEETVILHLENGTYYGLDPVGTRIWALIKDGLDGAAICARLESEFDVSPEVLRADVARFLDDLLAQNLLRAEA
jgi:hypothetical protein